MRKKIALALLTVMFTVSIVSIGHAAIHNPKNDAQCIDNKGDRIDSKDCDPNGCGCLFHEIEEFVRGMFK